MHRYMLRDLCKTDKGKSDIDQSTNVIIRDHWYSIVILLKEKYSVLTFLGGLSVMADQLHL